MSNLNLPARRDEWKSQVATALPREGRPPIPSRVNWRGGLHMSQVQFLSLRSIWPTLLPGSEFAREFETELRRELDTARNWLDLFPPFRAYLECVRNNQSTTFWSPEAPETSETALSLGIMQLARSQQSRLLKAISDGVADEEMVISSLVSFLDGITVFCPHVRCGWSAKRQSTTGHFGAQKLKVFVDGLLVARDGTPKVLLEAKRHSRQDGEPKVCWQETGEFVAFLKSTKTPTSHDRHFFRLSQNQGQCFVVAFSFDEAYVKYIRQGTIPGPDEGFVTVKRYGPYHLNHHEEVKLFARIALAIAIRSCLPPDQSQSGPIVSSQA